MYLGTRTSLNNSFKNSDINHSHERHQLCENIQPHPNVVALEVLKKNGVNIEKLKELINKDVGAEFTTYYYYTILRMHCTGLEGEGIKEIV